tara:strand:+ start:2896 stop:3969 length:1074 start_codon:yes stop_codon:yes gene_type:complete
MLSILKILTIFTPLIPIKAQLTVPGSQTDEHNCVLDGGYQWCEKAQACQRIWETPCEETLTNTIDAEFCETSNVQMCRMACKTPQCPEGQCAMRQGICCDYTCENISDNNCPKECPPPTPCPMPAVAPNCRYIPAIFDNCGCNSGCGTIDCSTHPKLPEGGICGGFMPYGMAGICEDNLECVYTMGPMVADAPGTCQQRCLTVRDNWGNCIDEGCNQWFDGCNTCSVEDDTLSCTEIMCYKENKKEGHCLDNDVVTIPLNCASWYDGCNTCSVHEGELQACTLMMCFTQNEPHCQTFTTGELNIGEVCYRFCEDGSQNPINRQDDCPKGTICGSASQSMISFDSCGSRAHTCNIVSH